MNPPYPCHVCQHRCPTAHELLERLRAELWLAWENPDNPRRAIGEALDLIGKASAPGKQ